ncbi:MAG TPA: glycosyltransferase [Prosthecobacter sp.]|nr:glycosyltransferase [Prosthecobacter sp.]
MSLRVLNILGQRPDGTGSGIFVQEIVRAGNDAGDQISLLCAAYPEDNFSPFFPGGVETVGCETPAFPLSVPGMSDVMPYRSLRYSDLTAGQVQAYCDAFATRLSDIIDRTQPHVIHLHHLWALSSLAGRFQQIPWVVTLHGTDLKQLASAPQHRHFVDRGLPSLRHFFSVSADIAGHAIDAHHLSPDKVSVIANGYSPRFFYPPGNHADESLPIVLCAGKFVAWKGFAHAIRASSLVTQPHRLVILGTGPPAERQRLSSLARDCGIDSHVLFAGHLPQDEVASWMRRATLFLLPSILEPFGLVLLEALACGCPAIAANCGGPRDIITPLMRQAGLATLVPPLQDESPGSIHRYESDFAAAIETHLAHPLPAGSRQNLAGLVQHRTWASVYQHQRQVYQAII